jgi:hypothetical protein
MYIKQICIHGGFLQLKTIKINQLNMKTILLSIMLTSIITLTSSFTSNKHDGSDCKVEQQRQSVQCYGTTKSGYRCRNYTYDASGYCASHRY